MVYGIAIETEETELTNSIALQVTSANVDVGQYVEMEVMFEGGPENIKTVTAYYKITGKNEGSISYPLDLNEDGAYRKSIFISDYDIESSRSGVYDLQKLVVEANEDEIYEIYPEGTYGEEYLHDLSKMNFEISRTYDDLVIETEIADSTLTAGDELQITMVKPEIPVDSVHLYFLNEHGDQKIISSNLETEEELVFSFSISTYTEPGTYRLESIGVSSITWINIYNTAFSDVLNAYMQDFSHLDFIVEGTVLDNESPVLESINMINSSGTIYAPLELELIAHDDVSGVESGSAVYINEEGHEFSVYFYKSEGYVAKHNIDPSLPEGKYHMRSVSISDAANNQTTYNDQRYVQNEFQPFRDLSMYDVEISETYYGYDPEITIELETSRIKAGESAGITVLLDDPTYSPDKINVYYSYNRIHENFVVELIREAEGVYRGAMDSSSFNELGDYHLTYMNLFANGNIIRSIYSSETHPYENNQQDFSTGKVTVIDPVYEKFPEVTVTSKQSKYDLLDSLILEMYFDSEEFYPNSIEGNLVNQTDKTKSIPVYFRYDKTLMRYIYIDKIENRWSPGEYALTDLKTQVGNDYNNILTSDYNEVLFSVDGTVGEEYIPDFSITVDKKEVKPGDIFTLSLSIDESLIDFHVVTLSMSNEIDSELSHHTLYEVRSGVFELKLPIEIYMNSGTVKLDYISLEGMSYYKGISSEDGNKQAEELKNGTFNIIGAKGDQTAPKLSGLKMDKNIFHFMESPSLEFEIIEEESGFHNGNIEYKIKGTDIIVDGGIHKYSNIISASMYSWNMPEGIFELHSITLIDNAGNEVKYTSENSPIDFSDYTFEMRAAYLENFTVRTEKYSYGPNETLSISGSLGLNNVGQGRLDLYYEDQEGSGKYVSADVNNDGSFKTNITVAPNEREGKYELLSFDYFNGEIRYAMEHGSSSEGKSYLDLSSGNYEIKGTIDDYEAPVLKSIKLDKNVVSAGQVLSITVEAEDKELGLKNGTLEFYNREFNKRIQVELQRSTDSTLSGSTTISAHEISGQWILASVTLEDKGTNKQTIFNSRLNLTSGQNVMDFSVNSFTTEKTTPDLTAPEYISAEIKTNRINNFTPLEITIKAKDNESGIKDVIVYYESEGGDRGDYNTFKATKIGDNTYKVVEEFDVHGRYALFIHKIEITDNQNNRCIISYWHSSEYVNKYDRVIYSDLSKFDIELHNEDQEVIDETLIDITETIVQADEKVEIIQMKETLLKMRDRIDNLEDTPENVETKEKYYEVLQDVLKIDKVVENTEEIERKEASMDMSVSNLKSLNLPEVLDDDVKSVKIELKAEVMSKEETEKIVKNVESGMSVVALYDMSLIKVVERTDDSSSSDTISNEDIKGVLTLRMAVPDDYKENQNLKVIFVNENGEIKVLNAEDITVDGVRYLYFQTDHFSMYGIMSVNIVEIPDEETPDEETPDEETPYEETPDEETPDEETPKEEVSEIEIPKEEISEKPEENTTGELGQDESDIDESIKDKVVDEEYEDKDNITPDNAALPKAGAANQAMYLYVGLILIIFGVSILKGRSVKKISK